MIRAVKSGHLVFILFSLIFFVGVTLAVLTEEYLFAIPPFAFLLFYLGWHRTDYIFLLLLVALPFSFEYNFTPSLGTDIPDEFLMLLLSVLLISQLIYQGRRNVLLFFRHPLFGIIFLSLIWLIVTVMFSSHQLISIKYFLAKTWYIIPFVIGPVLLLKGKNDFRKISLFFTGAIFIAACIVLAKHSVSGFSFATINEAASPFFRNHVNYSAMLVCSVPVLFAFLELSNNKRVKWIPGLFIFISLAALLFSYARGAWVALLVGSVTYWLIKRKWMLQVYILLIIISVASFLWLKNENRYLGFAHDYETTIFHQNFEKHLIATYKLKDISTAERFYRWIAGVRMVKDSWLTGFGPSTFYNNYKEYTIPAFRTWVSDNKEHSTVHNYFLLLLIEQGAAGLLLYLVFAGIMLWYCQRNYFKCSDPFYKTIYLTIGVILTMILTVNLLSDLIETDKVGSIFYLCAGLLISVDYARDKKLNSPPDVEGIS